MLFPAFLRILFVTIWISWYQCLFVSFHLQLFQLRSCDAVRSRLTNVVKHAAIEHPRVRAIVSIGMLAATGLNRGGKRTMYDRFADDEAQEEDDPIHMLGKFKRRRKTEEMHRDGNDNLFEHADIDVKRRRDFVAYDPDKWKNTSWYQNYVFSDKPLTPGTSHARKFRLRFRMPMVNFRELVSLARGEKWFPNREKRTILDKEGICLDLLMLGALRVLGRGWTFDDLEEATGVSQHTHRIFFHEFVAAGRVHLYPKYVQAPSNANEFDDIMSEFEEAGMPGCMGSCDATHVVLECCNARLRNQHSGGKLTQTARAYQITVPHRRQILASTKGLNIT